VYPHFHWLIHRLQIGVDVVGGIIMAGQIDMQIGIVTIGELMDHRHLG
jgi:hypothetical protein